MSGSTTLISVSCSTRSTWGERCVTTSRVAPFDGEGNGGHLPASRILFTPHHARLVQIVAFQRPVSCDIGHTAIGHVRAEMARSSTLVPPLVTMGPFLNLSL